MKEQNKGSYQLASVLSKQMKKQAEQPILVEFGVIDDDYNLKTDTFSELIPKTDYFVCRSLIMGESGERWIETEGNDVVPLPENLRKLKTGDRVLVFWIGADAVIVDIVFAADTI